MKHYILTSLAAGMAACFLSSAANATGKPPETKPAGQTTAYSASSSAADAWAAGGAGGSAQAAGGTSGASSNFTDSSRGGGFYVLPTAGQAAPLPGTLCPKGDSHAWGIGWNFFWTSTTSTRTELECLERVLAIVKAQQPVIVEQRLPPLKAGEQMHPPKKKPPCPKGLKLVAECRKA